MKYIGFGFFSKYYIYILFVFICQIIWDFFFAGFNQYVNNSSNDGKSVIGYTSFFGKHFLIKNLLTFIAYCLSGLIFHYFYIKFEKAKEGELSIRGYKELQNQYLGVEFESHKYTIIIIGIFISLSTIIFTFLGSLNMDSSVWALELIFLIFLNNRIFKIKTSRHHKVSIILLIVVFFTLNIISSFLPVTEHNNCGEPDCKEKYFSDNNIYVHVHKLFKSWVFVPLIFIIYIIVYAFRDYFWVKSKYLIDAKNVEIHKLLYYIGIIGSLLSIFFLIFSTFIPCNSYEDVEIINNIYFNNITKQNIS